MDEVDEEEECRATLLLMKPRLTLGTAKGARQLSRPAMTGLLARECTTAPAAPPVGSDGSVDGGLGGLADIDECRG